MEVQFLKQNNETENFWNEDWVVLAQKVLSEFSLSWTRKWCELFIHEQWYYLCHLNGMNEYYQNNES